MAGPTAGDRAPDAPLVATGGCAARRVYELFAGRRHTLLLLVMAVIWQLLFGERHPLDLARVFEAHLDLVTNGLTPR